MIAHENHRNLRAAYASEEIKPQDKGGGLINKARARMGLGPVK